MPTTEVVSAVLLPGKDITNPEHPASNTLKQLCNLVLDQDGCQRYFAGVELEGPEKFHMFMGRFKSANVKHPPLIRSFWLKLDADWDNVGSHEKFMAQDYYQPFAERFLSITTGWSDFSLFHVDFKPETAMSRILSAPVTEITTLYFENGRIPVDYEERASQFWEILENGPSGYYGYAVGRSYEDIESETGKNKVIVLLVGWESIEAEIQFGNSTAFEENVKYLKQNATKVETRNVRLMKGTSS